MMWLVWFLRVVVMLGVLILVFGAGVVCSIYAIARRCRELGIADIFDGSKGDYAYTDLRKVNVDKCFASPAALCVRDIAFTVVRDRGSLSGLVPVTVLWRKEQPIPDGGRFVDYAD